MISKQIHLHDHDTHIQRDMSNGNEISVSPYDLRIIMRCTNWRNNQELLPKYSFSTYLADK